MDYRKVGDGIERHSKEDYQIKSLDFFSIDIDLNSNSSSSKLNNNILSKLKL